MTCKLFLATSVQCKYAQNLRVPFVLDGCSPVIGVRSNAGHSDFRPGVALQAESRSFLHGQIGRPLRRSIPILLWRLAEEESHSPRSDFLVGLREALSGQLDLPARHARASRAAEWQES